MLNRFVANLTPPATDLRLSAHVVERRNALRIELPFPAVVRGVDMSGECFTVHTVLDNLSACGLYLRLQRPVEPGATLFLVVRLCLDASEASAPKVAVHGTVMRVEPHHDGSYGMAIAFERHRFLYADAG